ncbi:uncharacterized protein LOC131687996 [Topomyia yanbarensis]|uniref:uncharacterized protein LOC131687996 n=1 Tax=Topomyia yanbarensis TaxID=2498891 RepID=UPI00273B5425|nr:uncharacterized protein LOC131687996 [Topomyia yanbarensis]
MEKNTTVYRKINENYSITNAELLAIREALKYVQNEQLCEVVIITDSKSACEGILNQEKANDNFLIFDINKMRNHLQDRRIKIQWIPSHIEVRGNELADRAAVQATKQIQDMFESLTLGDTLRLAKKAMWAKWTRLYQEMSHEKGKYRFQLNNEPETSVWCSNMNLNTHEKTLSRIRTGHCLTKDRKYTWKWIDNENCETCRMKEDIEHILFHCAKYNTIRTKYDILNNRKPLKDILKDSIEKEYKMITKYLTECKIRI